MTQPGVALQYNPSWRTRVDWPYNKLPHFALLPFLLVVRALSLSFTPELEHENRFPTKGFRDSSYPVSPRNMFLFLAFTYYL